MTIGSLFSGIGGLELGLERAGLGPVIWQCEINPFCCSVLEKHWPGVSRHHDVHTFAAPAAVNLICGGFPCQDNSTANPNRVGMSGERSGKCWRSYHRIVAEFQPRWVVVENPWHCWRTWVPMVRAELAAIGYTSAIVRVCASDVGGRHRRARGFVLASASVRLPERWWWERSLGEAIGIAANAHRNRLREQCQGGLDGASPALASGAITDAHDQPNDAQWPECEPGGAPTADLASAPHPPSRDRARRAQRGGASSDPPGSQQPGQPTEEAGAECRSVTDPEGDGCGQEQRHGVGTGTPHAMPCVCPRCGHFTGPRCDGNRLPGQCLIWAHCHCPRCGEGIVPNSDGEGLQERSGVGGDPQSEFETPQRAIEPWPGAGTAEPPLVRGVHGLSGRLVRSPSTRAARIKALGNSVTPPQAEAVGWLIRMVEEAQSLGTDSNPVWVEGI